MTTFYTDSDLIGAGEFVEAEVSLGTEFTVPAGDITRLRWRWPTVAPLVTPQMRLYTVAGTLLATIPFDTTTLDVWNWATPGSPISVSAGTYVVAVNTTRYPAKSGFFSGGSIVRGDITGVRGRFASGVAFPNNNSTATYFPDMDFTVASSGLAVSVWNGSTEVSGAVTVYNGTTEVAAFVEQVT